MIQELFKFTFIFFENYYLLKVGWKLYNMYLKFYNLVYEQIAWRKERIINFKYFLQILDRNRNKQQHQVD